jgi:hypothetical protein
VIKKHHFIPVKILTLEALLRRTTPNNPARSKIEEELARSDAGYRGEKNVDYHLSFLERNMFHIFSGLRLSGINGTYFQLDFLLLTSRFAVILEVKNIAGTLLFDPSFQQLLRTYNEKEDAFADPILQLDRQAKQLQWWFNKYKVTSIPIYSYVVISQTSSIIKVSSQQKDLSKKIIRAAALPGKIDSLYQTYSKDILNEKEVNKLSRLLLKYHKDLFLNVAQRFQVSHSDILTGVHCPKCFMLPIKKVRGGWLCNKCEARYPKAHLHTLIDYLLLCNSSITNEQCRYFLHLPTLSPATKLLTSLNLPYTGTFRNRKYELVYLHLKKLLNGE